MLPLAIYFSESALISNNIKTISLILCRFPCAAKHALTCRATVIRLLGVPCHERLYLCHVQTKHKEQLFAVTQIQIIVNQYEPKTKKFLCELQ